MICLGDRGYLPIRSGDSPKQDRFVALVLDGEHIPSTRSISPTGPGSETRTFHRHPFGNEVEPLG